MTKKQKAMIVELRKIGKSYTQIANQLNVCRCSVGRYCREQNLFFDQNKNVCRECGATLVQAEKKKRKVFCSAECRVRWWNAHPYMVNQKAVYHFVCAHCGKEFTAYGNNKRKYCCHACYIKDRFGED